MTNEEKLLEACKIAIAEMGPVDASETLQNLINQIELPPNNIPLTDVLDQIKKEVEKAEANWPAANSAHEAFSVLLEEVDELWDHVKTNQKRRDLVDMRLEAIQVAAMAVRFVRDVIDSGRGRR